MTQNAPILLFCYKRLECLQHTVAALKKCVLAPESDLYIFSDGPKTEKDIEQIEAVRSFIKGITGFKKVIIRESEKNKGLAASIIHGVTEMIDVFERVIVLEDDLVVSSNFLVYMNKGLEYYADNKKVYSISGYTIPMNAPEGYPFDVYFLQRASSWGWATWKNQWDGIDWSVGDFAKLSRDRQKIKQFNKGGTDMYAMLQKQMNGEIDSWAIRWCYHQFKTQTYTVFPVLSKVRNEGFTSDATHTNVHNRYQTTLDSGDTLSFRFKDNAELDPIFLSQYQRFYSIYTRLVSKIKTYIIKARNKTNG